MTKRTLLLQPLLVVLPLCLTAAPPPALVYASSTEFQTRADVNGDGRSDLVIVDRSSGQIRIAETSVDDLLVWREEAVESGLAAVEGFSSGYLVNTNWESLVLSSSLENRIQIIDTPTISSLVEPALQMPELIGPALVTALHIPGGPLGDFSENFEDLVYHATLSEPAKTNVVRGLRNADGTLPLDEFAFDESNGTPTHPQAITLEAGTHPAYTYLLASAGTNVLEIYDTTTDPVSQMDNLPGLPLGADYVAADFDGDGDAEFIFWVPGASTLIETQWSGGSLTASSSFDYGAPIQALQVIESAGQTELLVIRDAGMGADRLDYSGGHGLTVLESFAAQPGAPFSGAINTQKVLHFLTGKPSSTGFQSYRFDGSAHNLEDSGTLPELKPRSAGSSVLIFDENPLTRADARLLSRLNAGPWTSAFTLNGGTAKLQSERFLNTASGLGSPELVTISRPPAGSAAGLTRQVFDDVSILSKDAPIGEIPVGRLSLEPGSGTYATAIQPELSLNGSAQLFYRFEDTAWGKYFPDAPPTIIRDCVFYAVAVDGTDYSNVVRAEYSFPQDPGQQDSNGDGLPDFVAEQYNLDPLASDFDSDGDGFSDLDEILAGTSPLLAGEFPERMALAFEFPNQFDLSVTPATPNPTGAGTLVSLSASPQNTEIRAHQASGMLAASARTKASAETSPSALLKGLEVDDPDLFLVLSSDLNFDVATSILTSANYGRQLASIFPAPELEYSPFQFNDFGNMGGFDDLAAEAAAWKAAALAHYTALTRPAFSVDPLDHSDTLTLLLVEQFLGYALNARGLMDRTELSLTPFRTSESPLAPNEVDEGDGSRDRATTSAQLLALQREATGQGASYDIPKLIETIQNAVDSTKTAEQAALLELTRKLYTLHALDQEPGSLRQPLDTLRRFLRTGSLVGTGYDKASLSSDLPASLITDAAIGASQIYALPSARTAITVYVYYDGSGVDPNCPLWPAIFYTGADSMPETPYYTGENWSFVDDAGAPFPIGRAFPLTVGSVFVVRGYELSAGACGERRLEVIPQPELAFLRNASANDTNGNLIPDSIEALSPELSFDAFGDSDSDGYTDLQELLDGSNPHKGSSIPNDDGIPAAVVELGPPSLSIDVGISSAAITFDYPAEYAPYIEFDLYQSELLDSFNNTGLSADYQGSGQYILDIPYSGDRKFYRLRMRLK